ncbi:MAG TPA: flavodoxin domain-containing protein [Bacillota bacterium]|nr:flavodoxin domain-containing protein [Bacillota bacterium]
MKTVVLYKSKTGFTKKYADWIAGELAADLYESSQITIEEITTYDTVIYGGGLYIIGINGVELITQNLAKLQGKKIVVFGVGASPGREEEIREVQDANFTLEQQQQIRFFYLRGGYDYHKLKPVDKVLMILLKWKIKLKPKTKLTADERGMLAAYQHPADFTRKKNIEELIAYVTS